jgi:DNA-directed RNA polymerase specialized sigma24 family protein
LGFTTATHPPTRGLTATPASEPTAGIEDLLREAAPQVLAAVVRRFGHFADSEDPVQDALLCGPAAAAAGNPAEPNGLAHPRGVPADD